MHTIATLIDTQPREARELVVKLSEQFRYTFDSARQGLVFLRQEIDFVRRYLAIEQARFGDRLRVVLPEEVPDFQVPALLLQPLVENAVRYGVAPAVRGGTVEIRIEPPRTVVIRNTVETEPDLRPENLFHSEHALGITRRRVEMMGGKLEVSRDLDGWVRVTVTLPPEVRWRA